MLVAGTNQHPAFHQALSRPLHVRLQPLCLSSSTTAQLKPLVAHQQTRVSAHSDGPNTGVGKPPAEPTPAQLLVTDAARPEFHSLDVAILLIQQWTWSFVVSQSSSSLVAAALRLDIMSLDTNQLAASALLAQALQLGGTAFFLTQFCDKAHVPVTRLVQYRWEQGRPVLLAAATAVLAASLIYAWGAATTSGGGAESGSVRAGQQVSSLTLVSIMVAPASEELLFRGVVLGLLLQSWRGQFATPTAIAASAVLFSAFHASPEDFVPLTLFGVVVGSAYFASGWPCVPAESEGLSKDAHEGAGPAPLNLLVPTLAHMMYNAFAASVSTLS
ncbi:MAG: hypothetical protein WDW38_010544 [Sanguina aurantia]